MAPSLPSAPPPCARISRRTPVGFGAAACPTSRPRLLRKARSISERHDRWHPHSRARRHRARVFREERQLASAPRRARPPAPGCSGKPDLYRNGMTDGTLTPERAATVRAYFEKNASWLRRRGVPDLPPQVAPESSIYIGTA